MFWFFLTSVLVVSAYILLKLKSDFFLLWRARVNADLIWTPVLKVWPPPPTEKKKRKSSSFAHSASFIVARPVTDEVMRPSIHSFIQVKMQCSKRNFKKHGRGHKSIVLYDDEKSFARPNL